MRVTSASFMLMCALSCASSFAATRTAITNGNWNSNATWDCNCVPDSNDNVIIPSPRIVRITGAVFMLNVFSNITITVGGELILDNGSLSVNSADLISISTGGRITQSGGLGGIITSGLGSVTNFPVVGPASISNGALPVELTFFKTIETSEGMLCTWESAMEKDVSHYVVERSADGMLFETLGSVAANGNSMTAIGYQLLDPDPLVGKSYYRLKSVDIDGTIQTFDVTISSGSNVVFKLNVFPNPVSNGIFYVNSNASFTDGANLRLVTSLGKLLITQDLYGFNNEVDIKHLEAGIYYVEIKTHYGELRQRIIKH